MNTLVPNAQRAFEAAERPIFEGWVKRVHPTLWPNPHDGDGTYFLGGEYIGQYYNMSLNSMWQSWLARALLEAATFGTQASEGVKP